MVKYHVIIHKKAAKEGKNLSAAGLRGKAEELLELLSQNPFAPHPPYEKLKGDLEGYYSRRINKQHRMVYDVDEVARVVRVVRMVRMWTHYE